MVLGKFVNISLAIIITIYAFVIGKDLLIPFIIALIVWFLIKSIREYLDRIKGIRNFSNTIKNGIISLIIFSTLFFFGKLLTQNIVQISSVIPNYEKNIQTLISLINDTFQIDILYSGLDYLKNINLTNIIRPVINSITYVLGNAFMVLIYVIFLIIEEKHFPIKLHKLFKSQKKFLDTNEILTKVANSVKEYVVLKTLISFGTGLLSYGLLLILKIDFAFFWAFLIFFLNFIPNIGSLIATLFPTAIAVLQFGSFYPAWLVLVGIGTIQVIVGNFVEPKLMGNSLNVSSLVVILSLMLWGSIWGLLGMVLSVPITVILTIVFAHFEQTKAIAIFLSEKGTISN